MNLLRVQVRWFRSIGELELKIPRICTVIGRNNSGKSNLLRAIRAFFFASDKALESDDISHFAGDAEETWIECTFGGLSNSEQEAVGKYLLHDGTIRVRRTLELKDEKLKSLLHGWVEEPVLPWLQEDYPEYRDKGKWKEIGVDPFEYASRPSSGQITKAMFAEFRENYIKSRQEELEFEQALSSTEFMGRQTTGLKVLPLVTFVPATGDVVGQVVGRSSSLLNIIVAELVEAAREREDYVAAETALREAAQLINPSEKRLPTLDAIEQTLQGQLTSWGQIECRIQTTIPELSKVLVDGLGLSINDGTNTDLIRKGEGIQRQILFQMFRLYADFRARRGIFASLAGDQAETKRSHIIIFEEPELYLHPQAQEQFYDDLVDVSAHDQVILSTHSNHLVRIEHADGLVILRRQLPSSPTEAFCADAGWVRNRPELDLLKDVQLLNSEIAKMFFADKIVLVEGPEDYVYIVGTAQKTLDCFDRRVAVVPAGNKQNIPRLQRVLNGFGIPYVAVYDKDPGDETSGRTTAQIIELVRAGRQACEEIDIWECDPNLPTVCGNPEVHRDKPYQAYRFVKENTPAAEFQAHVRALFSMG